MSADSNISMTSAVLYQEMVMLREQIAQLEQRDHISQALFHNLVNGFVLAFDADLRFTLAEGDAMSRTDLTYATVIGKTIYDILPPELLTIWEPLCRDVFAGQTHNATLPFANGIYHMRLLPVANAGGQVSHGMVIGYDVTESLQIQQQLMQQVAAGAEQEQLLDLAQDAILVRRMDGTITFWNQGAVRLYGFSKAAALGQTSYLLLQKKFPTSRAAIEAQLVATGFWEGELIHVTQDGCAITVASRWTLQRDREGVPAAVLEINTDITKHIQTIQSLQQSAAIIEATSDFVGTADAHGQITYLNRAGRRMIGIQPEENLSQVHLSALHPAWAQRVLEEQGLPATIQMGVWNGETALLTRDGREIPILQSVIAHMSTDGKPTFFSTIARDITERKQVEAERLRLQAEVIHAQQTTLRELSTPLLPISNDLVVMPLIGSVDSARAQLVMETLLTGVTKQHASIAIIDITGVLVVDTQVAYALIRAVQAVKLLGTRVILTGIRPEVAQTLVGLGVNLSEIITRGTLQDGISLALRAQTLRSDPLSRREPL